MFYLAAFFLISNNDSETNGIYTVRQGKKIFFMRKRKGGQNDSIILSKTSGNQCKWVRRALLQSRNNLF